jgi:hypothetical protein
LNELLKTLGSEPLWSLLVWATIFSIFAFYTQRPHHERPDLQGASIPLPLLMYVFAHLAGWVVLLSIGYV